MSVLAETHAGRAELAEADRLLCRQHLTGLLGVAPWLNIQVRIALAHAAALVDNRAEVTALVAEAEQLATEIADPLIVRRQLAGLRRANQSDTAAFGPPWLTTAELRVLQFMPTHLTNAEIAERLYVSRYTVKSQMISIYRKLGTNSRAGAVQLATAAGLIQPPSSPTDRGDRHE
jgi:LuxR family maltose regulon positive regulatory protein